MKTNLLLSSLMLASASAAVAAPQTPSYNEMALPSDVSTAYFRGSLIFADINADDNMDLLVKGRDLNNGWSPDVFAITTDAGGLFAGKQMLSNDGQCWERTLTALDFNNDGLIDYLLTSSGYELYKNNGDGTFTKMENFSLESNLSIDDGNGNAEARYMGLTVAADFNMDGYQDIVVSDGDGNPVLYINNGGDGSFLKKDSGLFAQRGGTFCVGDYNGDGCIDLLASGWSDSVGNDCVRINKNNGDGTFTTIVPEGVVGAEKGQTIFVDVDSDGLLDIFVTGESCPEGWAKVAYIFHNNGNDTFTKVNSTLPGACKSGVDWIDVNGDGNIDLVYAGETGNNSNAVVAINDGNLAFTAHEDLLCRARGGAAVAAYDVNRNGFPNIAIMGYNDNGAPHFHAYNGLCSRNINTAPTAPVNPTMTAGDGYVTFTWGAASDSKTPTKGLRYNVYVKTTDGKIITNVPANIATGALRLGDVNAALTSCSYELNIKASEIAEWGVQAIDGGKYASQFAKGTSGVDAAVGDNDLTVKCADGTISVNADAEVAVFDLSGRIVASEKAVANESIAIEMPAGVYLVKAQAGSSTTISKVIIR